MRKRSKRKNRQRRTPLIKVGMTFYEAWNLGFLNESAITTLTNKLGPRSTAAYHYAAIKTDSLLKDTHFQQFVEDCLTTPYVQPFLRMAGATGMDDRMPKDSERLSTDEISNFEERAWGETWNFLINSIELSRCEHVSFQQEIVRQAEHFFWLMKKETLRWVNREKKSPCRCCPRVTFDVVDADLKSRTTRHLA